MGQEAIMGENLTKQIHVFISPELKRRVTELAKVRNVSIGAVIRGALEKELRHADESRQLQQDWLNRHAR